MGLGLLQDRDIPGNELIALMPLLETGAFDVQNRIAERLRSTADLPLSLLLRLVDSTKRHKALPPSLSTHWVGTLNHTMALTSIKTWFSNSVSIRLMTRRLCGPNWLKTKVRNASHSSPTLNAYSQLNSGRATRDAILTYLREQSLAEQSRAESVLDLLEWMCHAHVVVDQLYSLETLALVQEQFPTLQTSIEL